MRTFALLFLIGLITAPAAWAQLPAATDSALASDPVYSDVDDAKIALVLDPTAPTDLRQPAFVDLKHLADEGNAETSYILGSLYRLGMDHPAGLVARDDSRAAAYLGIAATHGKLAAMPSLAELELS